MSMSDPHNHKDQFGLVQNLQMSPIPQTNFLVGTFFAVSYSKTALVDKGQLISEWNFGVFKFPKKATKF